MKIEAPNSILIIEPSSKDLEDIKVIFEKEQYDKLLYVVQFIGASDVNSYETFIWFEKDGLNYLFFEYENTEHMSFHYDKYIADLDKFTEMIEKYEFETNFSQTIRRHWLKKELDTFLEENEYPAAKKSKI